MSTEDLIAASTEIDLSAGSYQRAQRYYRGSDSTRYLNGMLDDFFKSQSFDGTLNYASIPVNAVADRLQLLTIKGPTDEITKQISDLWDANKMQLRFGQFILDVLTYGDFFMSIWPEDLDDTELMDLDRPASLLPTAPLNHKAKIMFADALTTRAFYDDGGELMYVARKWEEKDADDELIQRVNIYYDTVIEKYWWYSKDDVKTANEWLDEGQTEWPMENPFEQNPMFHFSTGFPHGMPEHEALYGVQDAINKIFQTHIASIEYLGFPIIYALMDDTNAAGTSDFEYSPIDDQDEANLATGLKNEPGQVWALRAQSVGQLEPAGSTSFIDSLKQYKEIASEISGLPARLFSSTDGQHPGADAVNAADAVLRQRVVDRSIMLSEALKQAVSFSLRLAYGIEVPPQDISILWRPQKIEIDADTISVFEFKLLLGMSPRQILSEMGYTPAELDQVFGEGNDGREQYEKRLATQKAQERNAGQSGLQVAKDAPADIST